MRVSRSFEPETTVSARLGAGRVEIDEDFRMAQCATTSVTDRHPTVDQPDGLLLDQLDGGQRVGLSGHVGLLEPRPRHGTRLGLLTRAPGHISSWRRFRARWERGFRVGGVASALELPSDGRPTAVRRGESFKNGSTDRRSKRSQAAHRVQSNNRLVVVLVNCACGGWKRKGYPRLRPGGPRGALR